MSEAARGVSFIFGRFLGQKLENAEFCVVFVKKTMFRTFFVLQLFVFFLVRFLRNCRKYHAFCL